MREIAFNKEAPEELNVCSRGRSPGYEILLSRRATGEFFRGSKYFGA